MHPTLPTFIQNFHSDFAFHSKANVLLAIIRGNDVKTKYLSFFPLTKPIYCASTTIEDKNGLTSNIPLLAVLAGTHPPVHIIRVIHRMKTLIS
ncbi:hypothetical protein T05_3283 [Trichinella murrelli]|uniref:Uncharacterized protein n=1 Tax=Trichinella murrelli TaxID=144512 RepID=A0A0V0T3N0_9BILA|nr:hypothetical protein T05_3283 [Trichinella murrelli]